MSDASLWDAGDRHDVNQAGDGGLTDLATAMDVVDAPQIDDTNRDAPDASVVGGGNGGDAGVERGAPDSDGVDDGAADQDDGGADGDATSLSDAAPDNSGEIDVASRPDTSADGPTSSCVTASAADVWTNETPPAGGRIFGVFALAPDDAWAAMESTVIHWDGLSWTTAFTSTCPCTAFTNVWAAGPQDVWAVGGVTAHWDGSAWTLREPPSPWYGAAGIVGLASNDVWMLGHTQVAHWDGAAWTVAANPFAIQALWPVSTNDVWMAGTGDLALHWDGASWKQVATGLPADSVGGIWGSSANDIWMGTLGGIYHYDGVGWSRTTRTLQTGGQFSPTLWGSCANDVWMLLGSGGGYVAHFDGLKWSRIVVPSSNSFTGIGGSGPDDVWIVRNFQTLAHRHIGPPQAECGNFRVDSGETCDPPDGNTCTAACQRIPGCGDGVLQPGEECDPPEPFVCGSNCKLLPICGNGLIDTGETCDPPVHTVGFPYWCDSTCQKQVDACSLPGYFCDSVVPCCTGSCMFGFCR